jgi:hypothetical protein
MGSLDKPNAPCPLLRKAESRWMGFEIFRQMQGPSRSLGDMTTVIASR